MKTQPSHDPLERLRAQVSALTTAERRVAEAMLADGELEFRTLPELARRSGAGYATVVRVCRKLGCAGFQDFKILLARARGRGPSKAPETRPLADPTRAAAAVAKAGRVLCFGVGSSAPVARLAAWRLARLGLFAVAGEDVHGALVLAEALGRGDAAVLVSFSGATKEVLDVARVVRGRRARGVALLNDPDSPLAGEVEDVLATHLTVDAAAAETLSVEPTVALLERFVAAVQARRPGSMARIAKTARALAEYQL